MSATLHSLFMAHLNETPNGIWLMGRDGFTRTYAEVYADVDHFARGMAGFGIKRGDVVTSYLKTPYQVITLKMACWFMGVSVFSADNLHAEMMMEYSTAAGSQFIMTEYFFGQVSDQVFGSVDWAPANPEDTLMVRLSSGTTGPRKLSFDTNTKRIGRALKAASVFETGPSDRIYLNNWFEGGQVNNILHSLVSGCRYVVHSDGDFTELLEETQPTYIVAVQDAMSTWPMDAFLAADISSVRFITPKPTWSAERCETVEAAMPNGKMRCIYTSSDLCWLISTAADDPANIRWTSIGRVDGIDSKVEENQIWVKNDKMCRISNPEQVAGNISPDGVWYRTGDVVTVDAEGYLYLTGERVI